MLHRFSAAAAITGLAALLCVPGLSTGEEPTVKGGTSEMVTWKLGRLNQEPFRLIKATPDQTGTQVRFLIEFTRPITLAEEIDWTKGDGPILFRFLDADGVGMKTVKPHWEGEWVPKKGTRLRLVLPMPDQRILALTQTIEVDS